MCEAPRRKGKAQTSPPALKLGVCSYGLIGWRADSQPTLIISNVKCIYPTKKSSTIDWSTTCIFPGYWSVVVVWTRLFRVTRWSIVVDANWYAAAADDSGYF